MPLTDAETRELEIRRELQKRESRTPEEAAKWEERYRRQTARAADPRTPAERMQAGRETVFQDQPWYEEMYGGAQKPFKETAIGARALVEGGLSPEAAGQLRQLQGVSGAAGTTGEILGNIGMFAAPGGVGTKAVTKGASVLPKVMADLAKKRALNIPLGGMASTAAIEGVREPGDLGERAQAAGTGALAAGVLPVAGKGLSRTLKALKRNPEAAGMLAKGIPLTPGMAAKKGGFVEGVENIMANVPGIAGKVNKQRQAALNAWNKSILQEVAPPGTTIENIGTRGVQQVQQAYRRQYTDLWNRVGNVGPQTSAGFAKGAQEASEMLIPKHAKRVSGMLANWNRRVNLANKAKDTGRHIDKLDDEIRLAISKAKTPPEKEILQAARQSLRAGLPQGADDALKTLDGAYAKYAVIERAATAAKATRMSGVFTPDELTSAVKQQGGRYRTAGGQALLQPESRAAQETIDRLIPPPAGGTLGQKLSVPIIGAGAVTAPQVVLPAVAAGRLAVSEPARKLLTGQYTVFDKQGAMAKLLKKGGKATRAGTLKGLKGARVGGPTSYGVMKALEDEDEPRRPAAIYNPARR